MSDSAFELFDDLIDTPFGEISEEDISLMDDAYKGADEKGKPDPICDCPFCRDEGREGGVILEGDNTFYCSNATKKNGKICGFIVYKNNIERLVRRDITEREIKSLCETGRFEATCVKIGGSRKYKGIFVPERRDNYVSLRLTFPEKDEGGEVHAVQDKDDSPKEG